MFAPIRRFSFIQHNRPAAPRFASITHHHRPGYDTRNRQVRRFAQRHWHKYNHATIAPVLPIIRHSLISTLSPFFSFFQSGITGGDICQSTPLFAAFSHSRLMFLLLIRHHAVAAGVLGLAHLQYDASGPALSFARVPGE